MFVFECARSPGTTKRLSWGLETFGRGFRRGRETCAERGLPARCARVSRPRTSSTEGLQNHQTIIPGLGDLRSAVSARSGDLRRARREPLASALCCQRAVRGSPDPAHLRPKVSRITKRLSRGLETCGRGFRRGRETCAERGGAACRAVALCAGLPTPHDFDRRSPELLNDYPGAWRPSVVGFGEVGRPAPSAAVPLAGPPPSAGRGPAIQLLSERARDSTQSNDSGLRRN